MMLPHIKFFGAMSLLYIALGVAWAALYARYWTEVFTLQHCITAVLALGMMEMSTWCAAPPCLGSLARASGLVRCLLLACPPGTAAVDAFNALQALLGGLEQAPACFWVCRMECVAANGSHAMGARS